MADASAQVPRSPPSPSDRGSTSEFVRGLDPTLSDVADGGPNGDLYTESIQFPGGLPRWKTHGVLATTESNDRTARFSVLCEMHATVGGNHTYM
jgi:hypothetical protein